MLRTAAVSGFGHGSADVGGAAGGAGVAREVVVFKGALDLVLGHAAAEGGEAEGEVGCGGAVLVPG